MRAAVSAVFIIQGPVNQLQVWRPSQLLRTSLKKLIELLSNSLTNTHFFMSNNCFSMQTCAKSIMRDRLVWWPLIKGEAERRRRIVSVCFLYFSLFQLIVSTLAIVLLCTTSLKSFAFLSSFFSFVFKVAFGFVRHFWLYLGLKNVQVHLWNTDTGNQIQHRGCTSICLVDRESHEIYLLSHTSLKSRGPSKFWFFFFFFLPFLHNRPVFKMSSTVANRTYPIGHGHQKEGLKQVKLSYSRGETAEEPLVDILGCISVKRKVSNEIIQSVKCSSLWADRAINSRRPSMTSAQERQQECETRLNSLRQMWTCVTSIHKMPQADLSAAKATSERKRLRYPAVISCHSQKVKQLTSYWTLSAERIENTMFQKRIYSFPIGQQLSFGLKFPRVRNEYGICICLHLSAPTGKDGTNLLPWKLLFG